jgi:hypothetical protein
VTDFDVITTPARIEAPTPADSHDITHWHCCDEPDALLCGRSGAGMPIDAVVEAECVECAVEADRGWCPKTGRCHTDEETSQ